MKMLIKVYGPGCNRCQRAYQVMQEAVIQSGADACVEKVDDVQEMVKAGVFATPLITINGKSVASARVPKVAEAVSWIMNALVEEE